MTACGNDWEEFGDRCYLWGDKKMSWDDAEAFCRRKGGHLASVTSEDINAFVLQEKMLRNLEHLWIGGSDKENEDSWSWSDGSLWSFTKWFENQPNNADGNEDCLQVYPDEKWYDRPCAENESFVCSQKLCSGEISVSFILNLMQIFSLVTPMKEVMVEIRIARDNYKLRM